MTKQIQKTVFLVVAVALLGGCSKFTGLFGAAGGNPIKIADKFWAATKTGNVEKIKPFVTKASMEHQMMQENAKPNEGEYTLGKANVDGNVATIPTKLKDKQMDLDVQTILVKEGGNWKVDVNKTMMSMFSDDSMKELLKGLQDAGKKISEGLSKPEETPEEPAKAAPAAPEQPEPEVTHFQNGEKVMVEWHGAWYPSTVLQLGSNKWKIHYDGYSNSWDEWVGPNRIKK